MQSSENTNSMSHKCRYCGNEENFVISSKGPHLGLYCKKCGKWITWIKKDKGKKYQMTIDDIVKGEENSEPDTEGIALSDKEYEDAYFGECPWD